MQQIPTRRKISYISGEDGDNAGAVWDRIVCCAFKQMDDVGAMKIEVLSYYHYGRVTGTVGVVICFFNRVPCRV